MSELLLGDCLERMAEMEPDSVDSIVTDPPYGLGFMGKKWDGTPPGDEVASAMLRVLKPCHYLLAFGGTRTHHRLMVALEDAGFEIRDTLLWLFGTGFPKGKGNLKPAYEPIILCRKPGKGVRELGIDECRIEMSTNDPTREWGERYGGGRMRSDGELYEGTKVYASGIGQITGTIHPSGRWPANLILSPEAAEMLDEQSGERKSGAPGVRRKPHKTTSMSGTLSMTGERETGFGDSGGASRFFLNVPIEGEDTERFLYCAKAPKRERDIEGVGKHPTQKPVALMRWLVRLITPEGGTVLDPFMGSGTTGVACIQEGRDFIGIEREEEYMEIAEARIRRQEQTLFSEGKREE